jgi:O-antigen ligase
MRNLIVLPVLLLIVAMPLALAPGLSFYFDVVPKTVILLVAAAAMLLVAAMDPIDLYAFMRLRLGGAYCIASLAMFATMMVATALASDPLAAWNGSNWRRFGTLEQFAVLAAALLVSSACAFQPRVRTMVLRGICVAGSISALYGILQYFRLDPLLPSSAYQAGEGVFRIVRPPGTLGHSDYFGAWLLWPYFAGLSRFKLEHAPRWKYFGSVTMALSAIAILLSGTRGAIAGLAAGYIAYASLARIRPRRAAAYVAVAATIAALLTLSPAGTSLRARLHWASEDMTGGARPLLWRDSIRMALDRPWQGFGSDVFSAEFPKYQSTELARAYPNFYHESPHNVILDQFVGTGLGGTLAFLSILVIAGLAVTRGSSDYLLTATLASGLVGTFVAQQFAVFTSTTAFYFLFVAGLMVGLSAERPPQPACSRAGRFGFAGLALVVASVFFISGIRIGLADRDLAAASQCLDGGKLSAAITPLSSAAALRNTGVSADLYFARRWARESSVARNPFARAQFAQFARNAALSSTRVPEQRSNAYYNLAVLAAGANDMPTAEASLRASIQSAPKWFKPHWSLARILFATGRSEEARNEAQRALDLNGGKDPEVTSTLNEIFRSPRRGQ